MALSGWVAKHTGLPSIYVTTPGEVYAGDRLLVVAEGHTIVSDVLAPAGTSVTYRQGGSSVTLTRAKTSPELATITGLDGQGFTGIYWHNEGDDTEWESTGHRFDSGVTYWPLRKNPRTGSATLVLDNPAERERMWGLLSSNQPLIISTGDAVPGVPPVRAIVVSSVKADRASWDGVARFQVSWTEVPLDSPTLANPDGGTGAVRVVTWGSWDKLDRSWQPRTYRDLCKLIAGMP